MIVARSPLARRDGVGVKSLMEIPRAIAGRCVINANGSPD